MSNIFMRGPMGSQGPAGADGADGADGDPGATGPQGPGGANGANGAQGPAGADGLDGLDGADGLEGPEGPPGADGLGAEAIVHFAFHYHGTNSVVETIINSDCRDKFFQIFLRHSAISAAECATNPGSIPTPTMHDPISVTAQYGNGYDGFQNVTGSFFTGKAVAGGALGTLYFDPTDHKLKFRMEPTDIVSGEGWFFGTVVTIKTVPGTGYTDKGNGL